MWIWGNVWHDLMTRLGLEFKVAGLSHFVRAPVTFLRTGSGLCFSGGFGLNEALLGALRCTVSAYAGVFPFILLASVGMILY